MISINAKRVIDDSISRACGFDKYRIIMNNYIQTDVSKDKNFQTLFDGYYKVRRNEAWRSMYYDLFQKSKGMTTVSFEYILRTLYKNTNGRIEPSFASKLLATLNPDKPIWDQYVIKNLGKKIVGRNNEEKLKSAILIYEEIDKEIHQFIKSSNGSECIRKFDEVFPDYSNINPVKKIDFYLWSKRS